MLLILFVLLFIIDLFIVNVLGEKTQAQMRYEFHPTGSGVVADPSLPQEAQSSSSLDINFAPAGNRTRVCTVAGYYSTTRPLVPCWLSPLMNQYILSLVLAVWVIHSQ